MVHDVMPGTEEQLTKEMTAGYVGFDPTAASLHIGNLATIMLLSTYSWLVINPSPWWWRYRHDR
jgi:hypothetical protein